MSQDRKPWLFLKRVHTWNPLAGVRHLIVPEPQKKDQTLEKRWV